MKRSGMVLRSFTCAVLTLTTILFTACGSDSGADDPNLGVYEATTAKMSGIELNVKDVWEDGLTIELKKGGKAHLQSGDEGGNFKWKLDGETFHGEGGGATFDGTVKDGVMVLEDLEGSGVTVTLVCNDIVSSHAGKEKAGTAGQDGENSVGSSGSFGDESAEAEESAIDENSDSASVIEAGSDEAVEANDSDTVSGYYDAVAAIENDQEEVWIEPGEYLTVNDDGSVSMYVAEQDLSFDTTINNNKFYLNGDTKVGEVNADGSITLSLSDTVKYVFAKKGSDKWNEWQEVVEETSASAETAGEEQGGSLELVDNSIEETVKADYDFDEALKLVGDYNGILLFGEEGQFYGKSFNGIGTNAFARIVIDEKKEPVVFIRSIMGDSANFKNIKSEFRDDGWISVTGVIGTDNGDKEWFAIIKPPVGNEPICVEAVLTSDYETPMFSLYLKPIGAEWDYSYMDDYLEKNVFDNYVYNMELSKAKTIEDQLNYYQKYWDKHKGIEGETYTMITDDLPDASLLNLYK
ncbi:hypothetical protein [Butyrivibrio sp. AC2005]|uniref:hypothetical protein n=1 Tax=Butyrivibrio sp. AC2005 TaxID=1280672 RepID=UPI0003F7FDB7|nr:hypothetical protein [Butyrivibrio sp. AC2005]